MLVDRTPSDGLLGGGLLDDAEEFAGPARWVPVGSGAWRSWRETHKSVERLPVT
ncbi:hypothetical protein [Streptomyces sp. NPDC096030]|uniref:hypothetical protein n=1 Tax=Streptomyces sp. NPDC096030 TaxID=3155423 RepID=UPI0033311388